MHFISNPDICEQILGAIEVGTLQAGALIDANAILLAINGQVFDLIACSPTGPPTVIHVDGLVVIKPSPGIEGRIEITCPDLSQRWTIVRALNSCIEAAWQDVTFTSG